MLMGNNVLISLMTKFTIYCIIHDMIHILTGFNLRINLSPVLISGKDHAFEIKNS